MNIFEAIERNDIEYVKQYIEDGGDINIKNRFRNFPLIKSIYNPTIFKLLAEQPNIDVNLQDQNKNTCLHEVSSYDDIEMALLLLSKKDIDVNLTNKKGWTALHNASSSKYLSIFKLLLNHPNININIKNNFQETPLHLACLYKDIEKVKLLLEHPKIKIDFNIFKFRDNVKIYHLLKNEKNKKINKVSQILDEIQE
jgi:ankyrin repeat protein